MQNVSFRGGLLTVASKSDIQSFNTDAIVKITKNKNTEGVQISTNDGKTTTVDGSYTFAEIQKAFLVAQKGGQYNAKSNSIGLYNGEQTSDYLKNIKTGDLYDILSSEFKEKYEIDRNNYPDTILEIGEMLELDYEIDSKTSTIIETLDKAFQNITGLKNDATVYTAASRMVLDTDITKGKVGDKITLNQGYKLAEADASCPKGKIPGPYEYPILFEIKCPKGSKVAKLPDGQGILLPRQASYKIVSIDTVKNHEASLEDGNIEEIPVTKYTLEYIEK